LSDQAYIESCAVARPVVPGLLAYDAKGLARPCLPAASSEEQAEGTRAATAAPTLARIDAAQQPCESTEADVGANVDFRINGWPEADAVWCVGGADS
jgi:hypothetical protein